MFGKNGKKEGGRKLPPLTLRMETEAVSALGLLPRGRGPGHPHDAGTRSGLAQGRGGITAGIPNWEIPVIPPPHPRILL